MDLFSEKRDPIMKSRLFTKLKSHFYNCTCVQCCVMKIFDWLPLHIFQLINNLDFREAAVVKKSFWNANFQEIASSRKVIGAWLWYWECHHLNEVQKCILHFAFFKKDWNAAAAATKTHVSKIRATCFPKNCTLQIVYILFFQICHLQYHHWRL